MQDRHPADPTQADADARRSTPLDVLRCYPAHDGSLMGALESRIAADPKAPFLLYRGCTWSRSEFRDAVLRLAHGLTRHGIGAGDRIGIVARNHEAHALLLFAAARIGAILVPTNPEFGVTELEFVFGKAQAAMIVASPECIERARSVAAGLSPAPILVSLDRSESAAAGCDPARERNTRGLTAASAAARLEPMAFEILSAAEPGALLPPNPSAEEGCLIIFTSGTTGFPKGALHSQRNFVTAGEANVARLWLQPNDRLMTILPMFHVNALFYSLAGTLAAGACCVLMERFSASTFWDAAVETGATTLNVIEAVARILVARPLAEFRPEHRIRSVYGARADVREHFRSVFHIPHILTGFGMTEIPGVCCTAFDGVTQPGAMGPVGRHPDPDRPWAQCRVVDDDGRDVLDGTAGEFWVKHPIVMMGYFRDEELTRVAFEDGWFKTGDLVRRDVQGCFWFVTRKKDIIRRRGENIAGAELDRVVCEHPAVSEAAAIPVPSELGEDEILMCVVPHPGASISAQEVADWCRARLAPMKVPRFVLLATELPHTPTHKVNKQVLKDDPSLRARATDLQTKR